MTIALFLCYIRFVFMGYAKATTKYDVIVIGGGAAGMMTAAVAAQRGKNVLIIEKNNELGKKLKITGGGRCNITNAEQDIHAFLKIYGSAQKYLYSMFSQFDNNDTFEYFESRGLPLVIEARKRCFPQTQKAFDVFKVLFDELKKYSVDIKYDELVIGFASNNGSIQKVITKKGEYSAESFVLATGGTSRPETGSTGDGFEWMRKLGHTVPKPTPDIVPLKVKEQWVKDISGTSLSFMKIRFLQEGKEYFQKTGKVLFTHFGLSGPLILNSAKQVKDLLHNGDVIVHIDMYPHTDLGNLDADIAKQLREHANKDFGNVLKELVPAGIQKAFEKILREDFLKTKCHSITKDMRKEFVTFLKALPLTVIDLMGFDRAVVADGGVDINEIDMRTMRSKKVENLFIVGDMLHINRPSGGYSLQLCWSSGYVAAQNV